MEKTRAFLARLGLPVGDVYDLPSSLRRFPDGAHFRIGIHSVEGPRALAAVLDPAEKERVTITRVSEAAAS